VAHSSSLAAQQATSESPAYAANRANVPIAVQKVESGSFDLVDLEVIAESKSVQTIPVLEKEFQASRDQREKGKIADTLVRLGVQNETYWQFLVKGATEALQFDNPSPVRSDSVAGPSPEFVEWAKSHNMAPEAALSMLYKFSTNVAFLAETKDHRAIPILREAMRSNYFLIQSFAAQGLAAIGDTDSIPIIIEACRRDPPASASLVAESLVYFDDARAQNTVDEFVSSDRAKLLRQDRSQGKLPFQ